MALVKCKECKKEISSKAELCPHCGYKPPQSELHLAYLIIGVGILGYVIMSFVIKYYI